MTTLKHLVERINIKMVDVTVRLYVNKKGDYRIKIYISEGYTPWEDAYQSLCDILPAYDYNWELNIQRREITSYILGEKVHWAGVLRI